MDIYHLILEEEKIKQTPIVQCLAILSRREQDNDIDLLFWCCRTDPLSQLSSILL